MRWDLTFVVSWVYTGVQIDKDTIKESGGHVYFWELNDYIKPNPYGELSGKMRRQVNCKENQYKTLSEFFVI
jgi:hypothetical protein